MSAYIVTHDVIDLLVCAAQTYRIAGNAPGDDGQVLGQLLLDENYASVNARYREDNAGEYVWRLTPPGLDPAEVYMAAACYAYQSCEHEGWHDSAAKRIVDAIQNRAGMRMAEALGGGWGTYRNPSRERFPVDDEDEGFYVPCVVCGRTVDHVAAGEPAVHVECEA